MKRAVTVSSVLTVAAFALGLFHLAVVSGVISISTQPMRIIHLAPAFSLLFALKPVTRRAAGSKVNAAI